MQPFALISQEVNGLHKTSFPLLVNSETTFSIIIFVDPAVYERGILASFKPDVRLTGAVRQAPIHVDSFMSSKNEI